MCLIVEDIKALDKFWQAMEELLFRVEGELSGILGALATGRNQGRLEGFTINMTSLDDIFLEVKQSNLVTERV